MKDRWTARDVLRDALAYLNATPLGILIRAVRDVGSPPSRRPPSAEDAAIRSQVLRTLSRKPWWIAARSNVVVIDRVVILQGVFRARPNPNTLRLATVAIPGVRGLQDRRVRATD